MSTPAVGTDAPEFEAPDQQGVPVSLKGLRGKWVVLYFYPKDDTTGCTKEACSLRDNHTELQRLGAVVLGVSGDSQASHAKFVTKYDLPFQLLVDDADHSLAKAYGAYGQKSMYGRTYDGVFRSTFIIDPAGKVAQVWEKVKPEKHGDAVTEWLRGATAK